MLGLKLATLAILCIFSTSAHSVSSEQVSLGPYDLTEDEIADLEDEVLHILEAGADLVSPLSLPVPADMDHMGHI